VKSDGIFRGLYAGAAPALCANVAENAVLFVAYGRCHRFVASLMGKCVTKVSYKIIKYTPYLVHKRKNKNILRTVLYCIYEILSCLNGDIRWLRFSLHTFFQASDLSTFHFEFFFQVLRMWMRLALWAMPWPDPWPLASRPWFYVPLSTSSVNYK